MNQQSQKKSFYNSTIINDFEEFIKVSDIIVANRITEELHPVSNKVYTRDIFSRD